jgi:hypothetical protein
MEPGSNLVISSEAFFNCSILRFDVTTNETYRILYFASFLSPQQTKKETMQHEVVGLLMPTEEEEEDTPEQIVAAMSSPALRKSGQFLYVQSIIIRNAKQYLGMFNVLKEFAAQLECIIAIVRSNLVTWPPESKMMMSIMETVTVPTRKFTVAIGVEIDTYSFSKRPPIDPNCLVDQEVGRFLAKVFPEGYFVGKSCTPRVLDHFLLRVNRDFNVVFQEHLSKLGYLTLKFQEENTVFLENLKETFEYAAKNRRKVKACLSNLEDLVRFFKSTENDLEVDLRKAVEIMHSCNTCKKPNAPSLCSACRQVRYCDEACQRQDRKVHRPLCKLPLLPAERSDPNPNPDNHAADPTVNPTTDPTLNPTY